MLKTRPLLAGVIGFGIALWSSAENVPQYRENLSLSAMRYRESAADDAISDVAPQLAGQERSWPVAAGTTERRVGRLKTVLTLLHVNPDSQVLVFSKTGFQAKLQSPHNPRAIYFNDEVAVGYVRGSPLLEVAALDTRAGYRFYSLDLDARAPAFTRQDVCLRCHQGVATQGVPGTFVGSVYPDRNGNAAREGAIITDHRSAFIDRWGGWYVDVKSGDFASRANAVAENPVAPHLLTTTFAQPASGNIRQPFSPEGYLSETSDVVALMTLEHQTQAANLITRLGWLSLLTQGAGADAAQRQSVAAALDDLLRYLLFVDEVPLPHPVTGASRFAQTFAQTGPQDPHGRSLREFDLQRRLFRYPLSYMIYSRAFRGLPDGTKALVFQRLQEILHGEDHSPAFARITSADRDAIKEILRATAPDRRF